MIMEHSITRTEQFSGALKSFVQQLRTIFVKRDAASSDLEGATSDWAAFVSEALQQTAAFSQTTPERRAALAQIMQDADVGTKKSIADWLLFADDLNEAHDAIILCDQQRREAA